MRKVVGYMTAQKKIKNIILEKSVPDTYLRNYSDVRQEIYDPSLPYEKYKYAMGQTNIQPEICLWYLFTYMFIHASSFDFHFLGTAFEIFQFL